jgi:hypothetical protein
LFERQKIESTQQKIYLHKGSHAMHQQTSPCENKIHTAACKKHGKIFSETFYPAFLGRYAYPAAVKGDSFGSVSEEHHEKKMSAFVKAAAHKRCQQTALIAACQQHQCDHSRKAEAYPQLYTANADTEHFHHP